MGLRACVPWRYHFGLQGMHPALHPQYKNTEATSASQFSNDATLKNYHWAICTGVFGSRDVGRVEREFLDVLNYRLCVTESDLLVHHRAIMSDEKPTSQAPPALTSSPQTSSGRLHKRSTSLVSCWSTPDSSELETEDSDSCSSYESCSSPETPEVSMIDDSACYIEDSAQSNHQLHDPVQLHHPYPTHVKSVPVHAVYIQNQSSNAHLPLASSAFQFLRSIPIPFMHQSQSSVPPQPAQNPVSYSVPYDANHHTSSALLTSCPNQSTHPSAPVPPSTAQWFPVSRPHMVVSRPAAQISC